MSTDHERTYIAERYTSARFRKRLRQMPDAQVLAIYRKLKEREAEEAERKKKESEESEPDEFPF